MQSSMYTFDKKSRNARQISIHLHAICIILLLPRRVDEDNHLGQSRRAQTLLWIDELLKKPAETAGNGMHIG